MADYHETPTDEMPDVLWDAVEEYENSAEPMLDANEVPLDAEADYDETAVYDPHNGWSLTRLFVLMFVLVLVAILLMQVLIPAAYTALHPVPTPTLRPPWMA